MVATLGCSTAPDSAGGNAALGRRRIASVRWVMDGVICSPHRRRHGHVRRHGPDHRRRCCSKSLTVVEAARSHPDRKRPAGARVRGRAAGDPPVLRWPCNDTPSPPGTPHGRSGERSGEMESVLKPWGSTTSASDAASRCRRP
jgi:hypothetical protein